MLCGLNVCSHPAALTGDIQYTKSNFVWFCMIVGILFHQPETNGQTLKSVKTILHTSILRLLSKKPCQMLQHISVSENYSTLAVAAGREWRFRAIAAPARCSNLSVSTSVGLTTHGHYGGCSICRRWSQNRPTVRKNLLCSLRALNAGWFHHFPLKWVLFVVVF